MTRDDLRSVVREVIREVIKDSIPVSPEAVPSPASAPDDLTISEGMLTEKLVRSASHNEVKTLRVARSVLVTPLARDAARSKGIRIERIG